MNKFLPNTSLRRIIHLADIHIRLYKRADEFRQVFDTLDRQLADLVLTEQDVIVVAGDIIHTKTDMSPEMVDLVAYFFRILSKHAPTFVIAGNHDFNMANKNRLDALSPVITSLKLDNLHYLRHSGVYRVGDTDFAVFSILDDTATWPTADDCTARTKIALFHGPVYSAQTDVGFTITSRHHTLDMFDGFDVVLLGDIHKHQVLQEYDSALKLPIVVYPGSLIQQNHGELPEGHGFCEWDVASRAYTYHEVPNEYGMYTIRVDGKNIPTLPDMAKNVRLRLFTGDLDESEIKKLLALLQTRHNIIERSITRAHAARLTRGSDSAVNLLDIHDVNYQNKLIVDFIRDHIPNTSQDIVAQVLDINKELNTELPNDDLNRKIVWVPKRLKFDNLFTYGEGNEINFDSLQGVVGLFAPNASGKSSIPDAICFALYDKTPRTSRGVNMMNMRKDECYCEFIFEIAGTEYGIERRGKKNKKGEVKIDVDFWRVNPDGTKFILNGEERRSTNDIIRQYVGDFDDFLLTAFSVQDKNSLFIDRGQSDRKDVLNQFMGLKVCDDLHQLAKDKLKEVAAMLKQFKHDDFTDALATTHLQLEEKQATMREYTESVATLSAEIEALDAELQGLYEKRIPVVTLQYSVDELKDRQEVWQLQIGKIEQKIESIREQIARGPQYDAVVAPFDAMIADAQAKVARGEVAVRDNAAWIADHEDDITQRVKAVEVNDRQKTKLESQMAVLKQSMRAHQKNVDLLKNHRFNPDCEVCMDNEFVRNAEASKAALARDTESYAELEDALALVQAALASSEQDREDGKKLADTKALLAKQELALEQLRSKVSAHEADKQWAMREEDRKFQALKDSIQTEEQNIADLRTKIAKADEDIQKHQEQADAVAFNAGLSTLVVEAKQTRQQKVATKEGVERAIKHLHADIAVLRANRDTMLEKIKKAEELETLYEAYDVYQTVMCRDGLPYRLIAEVIPAVQVEINNILSQMVEFQVALELDGKNINGKIIYDDTRAWPLELASGMEKFISGLAIRVALMGVSSLPKSNFLIVDEGFGALDTDNRASLSMLFTLLKTQFDFIILISHLDSLRDVTDQIVEISRDDGFSQIVVA